MTNKIRFKRLRSTWIAMLALLLVVLTLVPSAALAFDKNNEINVELNAGVITEEKINVGDQKVTLKFVNDNEWAKNLIEDNPALIYDGMVADVENDSWLDYRKRITVEVQEGTNELTIKLPNNYDIKENQRITINLSAAVIKNWQGKVNPVSFTIYANPHMTMGGSITTATVDDIRKGGKEIDFVLYNAKWNKDNFNTLTDLYTFLNGFTDESEFKKIVLSKLKLTDPNVLYSFPNEQTFRIKLPAVSDFVNKEEIVSFKLDGLEAYFDIDDIEGNKVFNNPIESTSSFTIQKGINEVIEASLTISLTELTENQLKNGSSVIKLTLSGANWSIDSEEKKKLLIEAFTANQQQDIWNEVKKYSTVSDASGSTVTITLPNPNSKDIIKAIQNYQLSSDQIISFTPPVHLLSESVPIEAETFTIKATPKTLISGNITPVVSQADIVKGGKEILIKLVNATWVNDIVTSTDKREKLLDSFVFPVDVQNVIKARAVVTRKDDQTVSITLPPIQGFKEIGKIQFNPTSDLINKKDGYDGFSTDPITAFTIEPVTNQSVTISGNDIRNLTEFDIAAKEITFSLTLQNDTWVKEVTKAFIISPDLDYEVTRKSDTVVDIKLNKQTVNISDDAQVDITVPNALLNLRGSSEALEINSAFKIAKVKASVSGTGLNLDVPDIIKGGKTIIITLENAMFKSDANFYELLNAWPLMKNEIIKDPKSITVRGNKATLKLPAVPAYTSEKGNTISITVPSSLIDHDGAKALTINNAIKIGQVGTAKLTPGSIEASAIRNTNSAKFSITLTGAEWDPSIVTNPSKKSALLKGFKTTDQTKEWSVISNAISTNGTFSISNDTLTIVIPMVPDYHIIRDQVMDLVIPKSVLKDYKYDIATEEKLTIKLPNATDTDKSFGELLSDGIKENDLNQVRIVVPEKKVQTISMNTVEFPVTGQEKQNSSLTTIEIITNNEVNKVSVTIGEQTKERGVSDGFLFVFANLEKNSEMKVTTYGPSGDKLQSDIYRKIGKGSKTYNELPKKDLTGSYSLYSLLTDKSLLKEIFKYYTLDELRVQK